MKTIKTLSLAIVLLGIVGCTQSVVTDSVGAMLSQLGPSTFRITAKKPGDLLSLDLATAENKALIATMAKMFLELSAEHGNADFQVAIDGRSNPLSMEVTLFPSSTPPSNYQCDFCQRRFKGAIRAENSDTIAFEKSNPARQPISFLVIPKHHVVNYKDPHFTPAVLINQLTMGQQQARMLQDPHDVSLVVNNGANSYQTVWHSHMHFSSNSSWK